MTSISRNSKFEKARLIILPSLLAAVFGFLISSNIPFRPTQAFSAGPPAGYTGAPGEEPEACAECHVPPDAGTGHIAITAPQTYVPGQTYPITVTHTNADPTRRRWGFELTVLDTSDERAGTLQSIDGLTQVLTNQGPGGTRQYIEHTSAGTFAGQQNGATWTFNWTAPNTDVGPVTFYAAGNHANNDGNTSGDYIYKTFVAAAPASSTPDFVISVTPSSRNAVPGASAQYSVLVTPLAGFTGSVSLSATNLPTGANAAFNPAQIVINDATSKTSTLTITTSAGTPIGNYNISVTGISGSLMHTAPVALQVISASSVDLSISKAASPNPGLVGTNLSYRLTIINNGPAQATNVSVNDTLPSGVNFVSTTTTQGNCNGTSFVTCSLGNLASGAIATVTITVNPTAPGQLGNSASVTSNETDFNTGNNTTTIVTLIQAAAAQPVMLDASLNVKTIIGGLDQPTSLAFIGANDFLVLEKATGKVQRIVNGALQSTVLDLNVNSASERGLLGIALNPGFLSNGFVYLFWSESSTGADTTNTDAIAVLGQRVDRYKWNGATLTFDRNLIRLRALQQDAGQSSRGNHNGGVIRFGHDGKLYILFGDNGRRGLLQNITSGGPVPDDQFGGPEPDDEHLTGVILRLNEDGTTPSDNPFFNVNSGLTGEAADNVKKVFGYGVRNGFGMAFDPLTGNLWTQENGDDAFDEMNRVRPGFNGGWVQIIGPSSRVAEYKSIESTYGAGNLQQIRWSPSNIADTPQTALSRLYMLPGAQYTEPEFSWKYAIAPSTIGFVGGALGTQFNGDLFVGASRTTLANGFLFRFRFSADRQHFSFSDSRLADLVADNTDKFDLVESESLLIGRDFGITTDIQTGPDGNAYVVSLSNGAVYQIFANNSLQLASSSIGVSEGVGSLPITVTRTGNTAGAVTVKYSTSDTAGLQNCDVLNGAASSRCDYLNTVGTLQFAPGETSRTIFLPIIDDSYDEPNETLTLTLTDPAGATIGAGNSVTITIQDNDSANGPNPIDGVDFFIRQQYIDFLGREPDPAGLAGWRNVLNNCGTSVPPPCDRVEVSAGFFRSEEFQARGYFIYRFYSAVGRIPLSTEFFPDFAKVSGFLSAQQLEMNKAAFVNEFMLRPEFLNRYSTTFGNPTSYVDALLQTVGLASHPSRAGWIATLNSLNSAANRALVLRQLVESAEVYNKYYNEAFVIMQYFGYLRRTADASYLNWIQTMNQTGGDYRIMINGFLNSAEYRKRFGP